jgi:hypothetical protein
MGEYDMMPFSPPDKIEFSLTIEQLRAFIRSNMFPGADIVVKDGKVYVMIPLDNLLQYRISGDNIIVSIPTRQARMIHKG